MLYVIKHVINDDGGTSCRRGLHDHGLRERPEPGELQRSRGPGQVRPHQRGLVQRHRDGAPGLRRDLLGGCSGTIAPRETQTCTITNDDKPDDVPGSILVTKTASPTSLPEPGGPVTFSVTVENTTNLGTDQPVATEAAASWQMQNGGGTSEPDVAGAHDATWSGTPQQFAPSGSGFPLAGDVGDTAVAFSGDDHATVPSLAGALAVDQPFTLEAWFRSPVGVGAGDMGILGSWVDGAGGPMLWIGMDRHFKLTTGNNGGNYLDSGVLVDDGGSWKHLVGTYDGAEYRLYVDGVLRASLSKAVAGAPGGTATSPFRIGAYRDPAGFQLKGQIASAAYYEDALSADEVKLLGSGSAAASARSRSGR